MKKEIHHANERGESILDWLHAKFSFSFDSYFNPRRMGFGVLRVINDDIIAPGTGFGMHPHRDMEIITFVTEGALEHKDSILSKGVVKAGEVQAMSAGTGIIHSEYNHSNEKPVKSFQIWILPREKNLKPRYDQKDFTFNENKLTEVVNGMKKTEALYINQDAKISIGIFEREKVLDYKIREGNGCFVMIVEGRALVENEKLGKRDAITISEAEGFEVIFKEKSQIMVIEVPMKN